MNRTILSVLAFPMTALSLGAIEPSALNAKVETLTPRLIETRRYLHQHPELSNREKETSAFVAKRLQSLGLEVKTGLAGHGVVGLLKGEKPGPVIAVRSDMDALPIAEAVQSPFASQNPGVMHACGHDVHMTAVLGVAEMLAGMRKDLKGSVKFIFQGAEEGVPEGEVGGAAQMIKEGVLENPRPKAIFTFHVAPGIPAGHIGYALEGAMAASDAFTLTVKGKSSHGAAPHMGIDGVYVASECVQSLQSLRSRRIDPMRPMVLSIGSIHGGKRRNILADEVIMEGTLRTLDRQTRTQVISEAKTMMESIAQAHGATCTLTFTPTTPLLFNDPSLAQAGVRSFQKALGAEQVLAVTPWMASEDFACYQEVVPGFLAFLGVGMKDKANAPLHSPHFEVDEVSLQTGVKAMTQCVLDALE